MLCSKLRLPDGGAAAAAVAVESEGVIWVMLMLTGVGRIQEEIAVDKLEATLLT